MEVLRQIRKEWQLKATLLTPECGVNNHVQKQLDQLDKAEADMITSMYKKLIRNAINAGEKTGISAIDDMVRLAGPEAFGTKAGRKKHSLIKLVTINAQDGIDPVRFFDQMKKCVKKSMLRSKRGCYVLEQRSEADQQPYGYHIHWLVEFEATSSPQTIAQQVFQCFSKYIAASNYVDVRDLTEQRWDQEVRYLSGEKIEAKMPKVLKDRVLRKKYGIPEIISY